MSTSLPYPTPKVFCVGRNKTGTTSMGAALGELGYRVGSQPEAELLMEDWAQRDFRRILEYCRSADAFQDVPFSLPYTYQAVDAAFPGSKFILTMRDSAAQWFGSLTRFHTKGVGKNRLPTPDDLKAHPYRRVGWLWRQQVLVYGVDERTLYDPDLYQAHYEKHNSDVQTYFRHRPGDLLVLNMASTGGMEALCRFLDKPFSGQAAPHLNRS